MRRRATNLPLPCCTTLRARSPTASSFLSSRDELTVATLFLGISGVVALSVSDLGIILELVGASAGVLISFILPACAYLRLAPHWGVQRFVAALTLGLGLVLLPVSIAMEFMPE